MSCIPSLGGISCSSSTQSVQESQDTSTFLAVYSIAIGWNGQKQLIIELKYVFEAVQFQGEALARIVINRGINDFIFETEWGGGGNWFVNNFYTNMQNSDEIPNV